ncbi:MAG: hypothetical protein RIC95_14460 [Vicingaceae bacterium]
MFRTKPFHTLFILLLIFSLAACLEQAPSKSNSSKTIQAKPRRSEADSLKAEQIKKIFYSLPSPMELTLLFKKEGVNYNSEKLHKTARRKEYVLPNKKALNLGVYGADLSYAGLFGRHEDAIDYFTCSQLMAEDLGVGQTFRKEFISRLEKNPNNRDTLLQVISDFFLNNDAYLKDQHRQDISTSILIGGWVEGMFLGTKMHASEADPSGIESIIAGQKHSLNNLLSLLENRIENSPLVDSIELSLVTMSKHYEEINYPAQSTAKTSSTNQKGELVLNTGQEKVSISDSTLQKISKQVEIARKYIVE